MMSELISKLEAYISGAFNREDFSVWFYGLSRDAEKHYAGSALEFVYEIESIFAEASSGGWLEHDLKDELESAVNEQELSNPWHFTWGDQQQVILAGAPHINFDFESM